MHTQQDHPRSPLDIEDHSGQKPGPVTRLLAGAAGLIPDVPRSAAETVAVTTLGASIILNSVLTSAGLAVLLRIAAPGASWAAIVGVAMLLGLTTFVTARLCFSGFVGARQLPQDTRARWGYIVFATVLAAFTAAFTAAGIVLALFATDIDQHITLTNRAEAATAFERKLRESANHRTSLENSIDAAESRIASLNKQLSCDVSPTTDCLSGTGIPGVDSESISLIDELDIAQKRHASAVDALTEYIIVEKPTILTEQETTSCGLSTVVTITREMEAQCQAQQLSEVRASELSSSRRSVLTRITALETLSYKQDMPVGWLWGTAATLIFAIGMIPLVAVLTMPVVSADATRETRGVPGE